LHSLSRAQTSKCWQQARLKWLQEGDANTNFFNGIMSSRRRSNAIRLLQVNDIQIEGVQNVHRAIYNHFSSHFQNTAVARPGMDNLRFSQLSLGEAGSLIRPFLLEEVK